MDALSSPVTELLKLMFLVVKREVDYLVHFRKNVTDFENQADYLVRKKNDALVQLEEAHRRLEEPTEELKEWLRRTDDIEAEQKRMNEAARLNYSCLFGWCPNWRERRRLSRKAIAKAIIVKDLLEKSNFVKISQGLHSLTLDHQSRNDFEVFETTRLAMTEVSIALNDEMKYIIGLYGMGGVGKTSLVKEIAKLCRRDKIYAEVVMVTVSQKPALKQIQKEIAEKLGLKLQEESESTRAHRLSARLKKEKKVLIVLDDIWERLELEDVGIPFGDEHKGCKILLTTRSIDVCTEMESQAKIAVEVLSEEDAWNLFKKKAGDALNSPEFYSLARSIAKECGGLPLALVTLGRALKDKDQTVWANAAMQLKRSLPTNIQGMHSKVFQSLMLSYDYLEGEEIRLLFLFCCLFPEDYNVSVNALRIYMMGEGLFQDVDTLEEASYRVHSLVDKLKASGLLLDGSREGYVKMHDVVRDVAMSIASRSDHGFLIKAGLRSLGFTEWRVQEMLGDRKRISLMSNKITVLPQHPECPRVRTLLLQNNMYLDKIPDSFFQDMKSISVLDLSRTKISSLPESISCIINLRTLCLEKCPSLVDISPLGELRKLEILSLKGSKIRELPEELGKLTNLRFLNLSSTKYLERVPRNLMSRLSQLEELYMGNSFGGWVVNDERNADLARFSEVLSLTRLTTLHIHVENGVRVHQHTPCPWRNLKKIFLSTDKINVKNASLRTMRLDVADPVPKWLKELLETTQHLYLEKCEGLKHLVQLDAGSFNVLECLWIKDCLQLEWLISLREEMPHEIFLNLKELYLNGLEGLQKMYHGSLPVGLFGNLKVLSVSTCRGLTCILSSDLVQNVNHLERLEVSNCEELKEVFQTEGITGGTSILGRLRELRLSKLPSLLRIWKEPIPAGSFSNLEKLYVGRCRSLRTSLVSFSQAKRLASLQRLEIIKCEELETLVGDDKMMVDPPEKSLIFQRLQQVSISNCHHLKNIFPTYICQGLQQMEEIKIKDCYGMEEVIKVEGEVEKGMLPRLRSLNLYKLQNVKCFSLNRGLTDFASLEHIRIGKCPNLKRLPIELGAAPSLRVIEGEDSNWFEGLEWENEEAKSEFRHFFQCIVQEVR